MIPARRKKPMSNMNRREFLVTAATAAAVISLPVLQAHADPAPTAAQPPIDAGPLAAINQDGVVDTLAKKNKIFIIREDGKVYAATSICTHRGAPLTLTKDDLFCPKHKSHFSFYGTVTDGPAKKSLPRYAVSTDANGHLIVDTSKQFSESQWDDPASFVKV
jgi:nitrite reductase/ring-hydroxylating ferredoxin subunit